VLVGAIETEAERAYGPKEEVNRRILRRQMIPRRGIPDDVAAVVAFLASADASFITAETLTVDGGYGVIE
jgi:3-oxoacyl-[acyl-carrier protein] reductase